MFYFISFSVFSLLSHSRPDSFVRSKLRFFKSLKINSPQMQPHKTLFPITSKKYATKRRDKNTTTIEKKNEHEKIEKVFMEFPDSSNVNTTLQAKCLFFFLGKRKLAPFEHSFNRTFCSQKSYATTFSRISERKTIISKARLSF